jgi:hypothetical protein
MKLFIFRYFPIITCLLFSLAPSSIAQVQQVQRYEFEVDNSSDYFNVISADAYGLLLILSLEHEYEKNKMAWQIIILDTTLHERYVHKLFLLNGYVLSGYDHLDEKIYLLFQVPPNRLEHNLVLEINTLTGYYQTYSIKKNINIQLTEFEIINGSAIFGGYVNGRPAVIQYFLADAKTKVYAGFYKDKSQLLQIDVNDQKNIVTVLTTFRTLDNKVAINVKKFNDYGDMYDDFDLLPDVNYNLIDGRNVSINSEDDIIAGTYSTKKAEYSRGFFLGFIDETGKQRIQYHNYAELENFFSYMKAKRQRRVKEKIERKKINGKKLKYNYRLMVHDIVKFNDSFILLGEAYYPKYNNQSYYGGFNNYYGNRGGNNLYYFEGYKYTHAVIICFDQSGNYQWDNSFEINDVISPNLVQLVEISPKNDEIILLYNYENVIRSKIIKGSDVIEGKEFDDILLKFQDDEVKNNNSEHGGLDSWYNDVFYAYGIQKIKNLKDADVKLNREVFFINKIIYN